MFLCMVVKMIYLVDFKNVRVMKFCLILKGLFLLYFRYDIFFKYFIFENIDVV